VTVIDTVDTTTPRRVLPVWHEKRIVATIFGGLGLIGLTVLVVAVMLVSEDSARPSSGHPVVVSVAPTPKPTATVAPSSIAAPPPIVSLPSPTEAPPAEAPPETAAAVPATQPPPNWQRLRRWLWAHQHPNRQ
jgi:hypothetical protein